MTPNPDYTSQVADIYTEANQLALTAVQKGYDLHAVADGLLEAARSILADNQEFMMVFEKFWAAWTLPRSSD